MLRLFTLVYAQQGKYTGTRHLWYDTPGTDFNSGLAIGNGRIGALVLGSDTERIILNENSVWNGTFRDRINNASLVAFPEVRELLMNGNITEAAQLVLEDMSAIPNVSRAYSVTNDLVLDFGHCNNTWENYERWLDTLQGNTGLSYDYDNVTYNPCQSREVIANFAAGVIAVRLNANMLGRLDVTVSLTRSRGILENTAWAENMTIIMDVGGPDAGSIAFSSGVRIVSEGGDVTTNGTSLMVTGATTVDLFYDTETEFRWTSEELYKAGVLNKLDSASSIGFDALRSEAMLDHSSLVGRVELDLGLAGDAALVPTDERITNYQDDPDADNGFITLMYNFGRHLLVSASRNAGGTGLGVPANLQGIWNDDYEPAWGSKYTVNINTEMNYWLAETTNLIETLPPLWDLMERSHQRGKDVAQRMYDCSGYVSHHNLDLWGDSAPHDNGTQWTMWPMSNLWLLSHMMEHYRFTGDMAFLKNMAWGLFYDAAIFFNCYLFEFEDYTSSGPSCSPENAFYIPENMTVVGGEEAVDISPTMDNSLLYEFFTNVLEIASVLGISITDDDILSNIQTLRNRLRPTQIGSYGQVQEWRVEYEEVEPGHRHLSPLWDLFPGSRMSPLLNKTLADAALVLLEHRLINGGAGEGWSRAWTAACYARLFDGNQFLNHTQVLLQGHSLTNLFQGIGGTLFQIDSNFGLVAAVTESLLQSHAGVVHLLPALADKFPSGSFKGLVARGGFEVSAGWNNGSLVKATIQSRLGGKLAIRVANGVAFKIDGQEVESLETAADTTYTITLRL
ncbi:Six-hairpin glycosidase-like protein [Xylariales sp. AK1849]|nr:Six-hairpin glycosidase-like protein [Xylariales sp. AK1849]